MNVVSSTFKFSHIHEYGFLHGSAPYSMLLNRFQYGLWVLLFVLLLLLLFLGGSKQGLIM
jgi:hypothetical protein